MKVVWITWEKQRRNHGISSAIKAELVELISTKKRLIRYVELTLKTIDVIRAKKPDVVIAQNPSIVLAFIIVIMKRIFNFKAVIDAHNSGIYPREGNFVLLNFIAKYLQKNADVTIVTNHNLLDHVIENGGNGFILPDKIPTPKPQKIHLEGLRKIVFICTFSSDEPYLAVIEAGKLLTNEFIIYITGNYHGKLNPNIIIPKQIKLTGYLPENEYWNLLYSADVIMDLTTRENCLVCGAYEGLSLEKPLILSNTNINKEYFNLGCIYVDSDSNSIFKGIVESSEKIDLNIQNIKLLKNKLEQSWNVQIRNLLDQIVLHTDKS